MTSSSPIPCSEFTVVMTASFLLLVQIYDSTMALNRLLFLWFFECKYNFIPYNSYRSVTNTDICVYTFVFLFWLVCGVVCGLSIVFEFSILVLWDLPSIQTFSFYNICCLFVCFHPSIDFPLFTQLRVVGNWTARQSIANMFCIVNQNCVFHILVWGCHIKAKYLHVPQLLHHLTEVPARHYPLCAMVPSRCPDAVDILDFLILGLLSFYLFFHILSLVQLVLFSLSGCD